MKHIISIIVVSIFLYSCYYDNTEELYPKDVITNTCDTTNVTYAATVATIMNTSCSTVGCHVGSLPAAGIDLSTYATVKVYADNGVLMKTIKHQVGPGITNMPKGGQQLTACTISQLDAWINAGTLNN